MNEPKFHHSDAWPPQPSVTKTQLLSANPRTTWRLLAGVFLALVVGMPGVVGALAGWAPRCGLLWAVAIAGVSWIASIIGGWILGRQLGGDKR